ncbi:MAG: Na+/H+ antiporter NhaC family protein [Muribaculaceae bacterium]|nr:Na+/H+ antiporter NhaC family protein [Muribaculaceae bacterium]
MFLHNRFSSGTARGLLALSPVAVFLLSYVAVSVALGDFYSMPVAVALLLASVWSVVIFRGRDLAERVETFSRAAGHVNILYMVWIFVLAGAFASLAKAIGSVEATVNLALSVFPPSLILPVLFFAACFISLSIGTSVGTVVALTPLAVEIAGAEHADVAFYVAVILGGAFFGDNLSFISDTTIAATRSQGCSMADKFKANAWIVFPAALVTLGVYAAIGSSTATLPELSDSNPWLMLPYVLVIVTAILGWNVTLVLTVGIASAVVLGLFSGHSLIGMAGSAGEGINSMGELIIVTLMAAGMLGIIKAAGGIAWLLEVLTRRVHGRRGAQAVISVLVGLVNLCTANNTVAIITVGSISRSIAERYGVDPRKSASLLDTASCIVQALIPYGAQTLLATSLASLSPGALLPYLYYPWVLAASLVLSIVFLYPRRLNRR